MKSTDTPILDTLNDYLSRNPIRMHIPFHGGVANNNIFPKEIYNLDISEVSGYDTEGNDNPIFQSEKITAKYFNAEHSFYLTGGASAGLLASMIALNKFGKKVILARNVHKSVINGVILSGLEPIWLDVDFLDDWGIFSKINPDKLNKIIFENNDISGCVIVSPTYEGIISDIKTIADICHKKNIPLIVDEAHGGHLASLRGALATKQSHNVSQKEIASPSARNDVKELDSSVSLGADLVIQSWHKTLGSLTQSGVLHLANNYYFTYKDIKRSLDLVSSTSPSFLLLLSLELTRKHLAETRLIASLRELSQKSMLFKNEIKKINDICLIDNDDPLKIYLKSKNISGIDFAYELYKNYSIEIESANEIGFLMTVGNNFNDKIKNKILFALNELSSRDVAYNISTKGIQTINNINTKLNPRKAFMSGFNNKNNEIESEIYAPCPPGYAINIPGDKK